MTTRVLSHSAASTILAPALFLIIGFCMIFVVGHVQAATIHHAAHDVRHAAGFPCH